MDSPRQAASLSPENQLLYYCSFPKENGLPQEKVVPLASQVKDWGRLLVKAAFHRLQPRLYLFLKRHNASSFLLPEDWKKIESAYHWAQAYTLSLEAELESVLLPRFQAAGVEVMLLKGAALLQDVYRGKPLRFFVDLDLLIHSQALSRVQRLLEELGYKSLPAHFPSRWHEREVYRRIERAYFPYFHPKRNTHIDLHVELFEEPSPFRFERTWLWEDARPVSVGSSIAFLPHPNKLFLHLLFHLEKHAAGGTNVFSWYLDLNDCVCYFKKSVSWDFCRSIIAQSPRTIEILSILAFLKRHLLTPLPEIIQRFLDEEKVTALPLEKIFSPAEGVTHRDSVFYYWNLVSGVPRKIWFVVRWLFPDPYYLAARYPFKTLLQRVLAHLGYATTTLLKGLGFLLCCLDRSQDLSYNSSPCRKEE